MPEPLAYKTARVIGAGFFIFLIVLCLMLVLAILAKLVLLVWQA